MKKILVTGANGQLGSDIVTVFRAQGSEVFSCTHDQLDIGNPGAVTSELLRLKPDVVINTAAFHHVDQCEADPDKALLINAEAPAHLTLLCNRLQSRLVHFSTDYVFDGLRKVPYTEQDRPAPLNVYGRSKLLGEQKISAAGGNHLVLRVSALYGRHPCRAKNGLNFVQLMLKLAREKGEVSVVSDEVVSPTSTLNIAERLPELLQENVQGLVHLTSEGSCSWYEFAQEIFTHTRTEVKLNEARSADFPAKTNRPKYSVLENAALKKHGLRDMDHWKDSLHRYLDELTH